MSLNFVLGFWSMLVVIYLFRNLASWISKKPKTIVDFMMSDDELDLYERAERDLSRTQRKLDDLTGYYDALQQLAQSTRKNKDGSFDRRGKNGQLLNQALPILPGQINSEEENLKKAKKKVKKYAIIYENNKSDWVGFISFNYAFHRTTFVFVLLALSTVRYQTPHSFYLIWLPVILFFILKKKFSNKLKLHLESHEKSYNIKAYVPKLSF